MDDNTIINALATLFGAIIGSLVTYFTLTHNERKNQLEREKIYSIIFIEDIELQCAEICNFSLEVINHVSKKELIHKSKIPFLNKTQLMQLFNVICNLPTSYISDTYKFYFQLIYSINYSVLPHLKPSQSDPDFFEIEDFENISTNLYIVEMLGYYITFPLTKQAKKENIEHVEGLIKSCLSNIDSFMYVLRNHPNIPLLIEKREEIIKKLRLLNYNFNKYNINTSILSIEEIEKNYLSKKPNN